VVIHLLSQPPHLKEQEQENAKSIMDSMWRASWLEQHALSSNTVSHVYGVLEVCLGLLGNASHSITCRATYERCRGG
jgi:hypothetical protein